VYRKFTPAPMAILANMDDPTPSGMPPKPMMAYMMTTATLAVSVHSTPATRSGTSGSEHKNAGQGGQYAAEVTGADHGQPVIIEVYPAGQLGPQRTGAEVLVEVLLQGVDHGALVDVLRCSAGGRSDWPAYRWVR